MVSAIYKNGPEKLKFPVIPNESATEFLLKVEDISVPLTPTISPTLLGLMLLANNLNRDELIDAINERFACLHPLEFDGFLDQGEGFREDFNRAFEDVPLPRVQEFSDELNQLIALKSGETFEFDGFELEPTDLTF